MKPEQGNNRGQKADEEAEQGSNPGSVSLYVKRWRVIE